MVVIAFGQKIAEHLVHHPRLGSVNLHASRLPTTAARRRSTGRSSAARPTTGNSVIRLAPADGRRRGARPVGADDRRAGDGRRTARPARARRRAARAARARRARDGPGDRDAAGRVAGDARAEAVARVGGDRLDPPRRRARPADPRPVPVARLPRAACATPRARRSTTLRLVRARPVDGRRAPLVAGRDHGQRLRPGRRRRGVEIVEVQPDGRTPMPLADYRRGHRWVPGCASSPRNPQLRRA